MPTTTPTPPRGYRERIAPPFFEGKESLGNSTTTSNTAENEPVIPRLSYGRVKIQKDLTPSTIPAPREEDKSPTPSLSSDQHITVEKSPLQSNENIDIKRDNNALKRTASASPIHPSRPPPKKMTTAALDPDPSLPNTASQEFTPKNPYDIIPWLPTVYPRAEEFKDPFAYVNSLQSLGLEWGVVKIVPPPGYQHPPFSLDTTQLFFRPRRQVLNALITTNRAKALFHHALTQFHEQSGTVHFCIYYRLEEKLLDWFDLFNGIQTKQAALAASSASEGDTLSPLHAGFASMLMPEDWIDIAIHDLHYTPSSAVALSGALLNLSTHYLAPFNQYISSPLFAPPIGPFCVICSSGSMTETLLLCDDCDTLMHCHCLSPPLKRVPAGNWYCPECIRRDMVADDFGFQDGLETCMVKFHDDAMDWQIDRIISMRAQANTLTRLQDKNQLKSPASKSPIPEELHPANISYTTLRERVTDDERLRYRNLIEKEYWEILNDAFGNVIVEYAADLYSAHHGSGFPTLEKNPTSPHARCPWNLQNLPSCPSSLLSFVKNDISGMTVPWLYVGTLFSTFCWHTEDHFSYSINYNHWGEAKTWYGVPARDAPAMEELLDPSASKRGIYDITAMADPLTLTKAGIKVGKIHQEPGEFIVTWPRAFHGGFNQGFNFAEAVNFTLPNWIPYGTEAVKIYKTIKKPPVFSHSDLLLHVAPLAANSLSLAMHVLPSLEELLIQVKPLYEACDMNPIMMSPSMSHSKPSISSPEDVTMISCAECHEILPIIHYKCRDCGSVLCQGDSMSHEMMCTKGHGNEGDTSMQLDSTEAGESGEHSRRFDVYASLSYADLVALAEKVRHKVQGPALWAKARVDLLLAHPRPTLKEYGKLLTSALSVEGLHGQAAELKLFIATCQEWLAQAGKLLVKRKRESVLSVALYRPPWDWEKDLTSLLTSYDNLPFDCAEGSSLKILQSTLSDLRTRMLPVIEEGRAGQENNTAERMALSQSLVQEGIRHGFEFPEFQELRRMQAMVEWRAEWNLTQGCHIGPQANSLPFLQDYYSKGLKLGVLTTDPIMSSCKTSIDHTATWMRRAENILRARELSYAEIAPLLGAHQVTEPSLRAQLETLATKIQNWETRRQRLGTFAEVEDLLDEMIDPPRARCYTDLLGLQNALRMFMERMEEFEEVVLQGGRMKFADCLWRTLQTFEACSQEVYCVCRSRAEDSTMIECDTCNEWYHINCIGLAQQDVDQIDRYFCFLCLNRPAVPLHSVLFDTANPDEPQEITIDAESIGQESRDSMFMSLIRDCVALPLRTAFTDAAQEILDKFPVFNQYLINTLSSTEPTLLASIIKLLTAIHPFLPYPREHSLAWRAYQTSAYCVCKQTRSEEMIGCDHCDNWFHYSCVRLSQHQVQSIQHYRCLYCAGDDAHSG